MSSSKISPSAIFTENGQKIYDLAFRLSDAYESYFVGTEHLLLAVLTHKDKAYRNKNNRTCAWLQSAFEGIDIHGIIEESRRFIKAASDPAVGKGARQNISPSLARAVLIAQAIRNPSGSEHLLSGILLAKEIDGIPNAGCNIIAKAAGKSYNDRNIQTKLINALDIDNDKLTIDFPKRRKTEKFKFKWCFEIPPTSDSLITAAETFGADEDPMEDFTGPIWCSHYISKNICCGASPGRLSRGELYDLVSRSKINTFICLQESYTEYDCSDYREILEQMSKDDNLRDFPSSRGLKFLHAPIPDFSIMEDTSLLGLVAELERHIQDDPGNNILYIHCYGGHGRTGTILTNLIMAIDGCDVKTALKMLKKKHKFRASCNNTCSLSHGELEASEQLEQSMRMKPAMTRQSKISALTKK